MMQSRSNQCEVLIAGAGIAAAAVAIRLRSLGFRPLLLAIRDRAMPGIEAIPEAALSLFADLRLERVLEEAKGIVADGFENHWNVAEPVLNPGRWIHVERNLLARAAIREAVSCGAVLRTCRSLSDLRLDPNLMCSPSGGCHGISKPMIDATGRSAIWSRPVRRLGRQVADLFQFRAGSSVRGRIIRWSNGWAYRVGLEQSTTVAMVSRHGAHRNIPDASVRERLGIVAKEFRYVGRRPAFPQWAEHPVRGRRLAVGDAALAHDPIAGQGIRFALASAFAAAAVVNTWVNSSGEYEVAKRFYQKFVDQGRHRHLAFLKQLHGVARPGQHTPSPIPQVVIFSGRTRTAELNVGSKIVAAESVELPDGMSVRWVGGVDLLKVRELTNRAVPLVELIDGLVAKGCARSEAAALVHWCLQRKLLVPPRMRARD